jgi:class 3 adenylate cyclase
MEFLQELPRRLVAVMFTDMVGYTALIQADELLAVDKRDRYIRAVERHHESFGGTIVQRLGDSTMSMFPSALAAAHAAVASQRELAAQDIPVRIGVHVGEVVVEPERLTGEAVNIASRVESFAVPGAVLLSDSARNFVHYLVISRIFPLVSPSGAGIEVSRLQAQARETAPRPVGRNGLPSPAVAGPGPP